MEIKVTAIDEVGMLKLDTLAQIKTFLRRGAHRTSLAPRILSLIEDVSADQVIKGHPLTVQQVLQGYNEYFTNAYNYRSWYGVNSQKGPCRCGVCRVAYFYKENGIGA